ncbi:hypothetical protein PG995_014267 [Apiospora arundinis]
MDQSPTHFASLLPELTLEEKVALLSGRDFSTAAGVDRLGIPPIRVADSVCGIRPSGLDASLTTASFPNTACYGATWDAALLGRLGEQLAHQARLKGAQVVLGPTINIHRDPRAGRNFECFSEDPLLSGQLAGAIVRGVQAGGVGACPKHFVANDAETLRHYYDVCEKVDGRTLREIYLSAWQHLLRTSDPECIMTAYNKVDGNFCSSHDQLYQQVLRGDWGFRGATMSDWFAVHDTVGPIKAGLDLEMPFPVFRGPRLVASVKAGDVTEANVDERALKMLELRDRTRACHAVGGPERSEVTAEASELAREIAVGGMVLLKNERATLPLNTNASIALVGEFASNPVFTGGGSASCLPQYRHSPIDVLRGEFSRVEYASGVRTRRIVPTAPKERLRARDGKPGADIAFYNHDAPDQVVLAERKDQPSIWMLGEFKPGLKVPGSFVRISTALTPETTGCHTLAVRCTGAFTLAVDGQQVAAGPAIPISTEQFIFNHLLLEVQAKLHMEAGKTYAVELEMQGPVALTAGEPTPYAATLAFEEAYSEDDSIEEAVRVARDADVSVVYAGRNDQYESEGFDLDDIRMPANQARLIRAVAAASKATVLVLHCGNPIDVSAVVDHVDAILLAHFPGQEGAGAVADLLTGPLPPRWLDDGTASVSYAEGVGVGYRAPQLAGRVRWPFGFGLSYTSWEYRGLRVEVDETAQPPTLKCHIWLKNTGAVASREVVQLYVTPPPATSSAAATTTDSVWRPERELKAFTKVPALAPGEERQVALEVDLEMACSYWDEDRRGWRLMPGEYGVL